MRVRKILKKLLGVDRTNNAVSWFLRPTGIKPSTRFNLDSLARHLPILIQEVNQFQAESQTGRNVFLFASMHLWIKHIMVTGLALKGMGNRVSVGYLPYGEFAKPISQDELVRDDVYARGILSTAEPCVKIIPFLDEQPNLPLPGKLEQAIRQITTFDTRYILQREDVTGEEPIFILRHERNINASARALTYFQKNRPEVVIVPNGMIQEFGAVYETARFLDIPVVTYEFGEQDQRIWIGNNRWVIHHLINEHWKAREHRTLNGEQRRWLQIFLAGRQKMDRDAQFAHLWQNIGRSGGEKIREHLALDNRPVVLLPTNVLGDSATLGLSLFSDSMTGWLQQVLPFLAAKSVIQLIIRIHPAESRTIGPSVLEIVQKVLPEIPPHFRLIGPAEKINSYDLMEIADLGLVYTTTAGLEMALHGIPVLVSGNAHYRKKGFTLDADSWTEYFQLLEKTIPSLPVKLTTAQLDQAWNYAYTFFAEYPKPFPWHLESLWRSVRARPIAEVLSIEGRQKYEKTFQELVGIPQIY